MATRWTSESTLAVDEPCERITVDNVEDFACSSSSIGINVEEKELHHPNFIADDDWALPPPSSGTLTRWPSVHDGPSAALPPEIWERIITWCEDPGRLVVANRMLLELSKLTMTKARFLLRKYGAAACLHGSMKWRFMSKSNQPLNTTKKTKNRKDIDLGQTFSGNFLEPCIWCLKWEKRKRDRKLTICGKWREAISKRFSRFVRRLQAVGEPTDVKCPFERSQIELSEYLMTLRIRLLKSSKSENRCFDTHGKTTYQGPELVWTPLESTPNENRDHINLPTVFAAMKGHLNLLTMLIDMKVGDVHPESPTETPKWMMDGNLLLAAVRKKNLKLVSLLSRRGACAPEAGGGRAYAFAASKGYAEAVAIMQANGAVATEDVLRIVLKKTLSRKMFGLLLDRENSRWIRVLESILLSLEGPDEDFQIISDDYLTSSLVELGSVRLIKASHSRGADLDIGEGAPLFFSVILGNLKAVRYLIRDASVRVNLFFKIRRVLAVVFLTLLNAAILGWCTSNIVSLAIAVWCWTHSESDSTTHVELTGWCAAQTGLVLLNTDYWLKTAALMFVLFFTVGLAQKTMPIHGLVLGFKEVICAWLPRRRAQ
ncbi:hypothetical protein HDU67_009562 [Dinochytrium kinnereticum]|nr:hypothetical protein HDU67_009562 [Dinochytrium kinnereticum]